MPEEPTQYIPPWKLPMQTSEPTKSEMPQHPMGIKILLGILVVIIIGIGGWWIWNYIQPPKSASPTRCENSEMIFYYLDTCPVCQRVKTEGTISKIEELGIKKVEKIDVNTGPINHQFEVVPTFVINGKVYTGYKTFEELKELLGC